MRQGNGFKHITYKINVSGRGFKFQNPNLIGWLYASENLKNYFDTTFFVKFFTSPGNLMDSKKNDTIQWSRWMGRRAFYVINSFNND